MILHQRAQSFVVKDQNQNKILDPSTIITLSLSLDLASTALTAFLSKFSLSGGHLPMEVVYPLHGGCLSPAFLVLVFSFALFCCLPFP